MEKSLNQINLFFEKFPEMCQRYKFLIWGLFLAITIAASFGIPRIRLMQDPMTVFEVEDEVRISSERLRVLFATSGGMSIYYKAKDGNLFSKQSLLALKSIQDDLMNYALKLQPGETSPLEHIISVKSLLNVNYLTIDGDVLNSRKFIGYRIPETEEESAKLREMALKHPEYPRVFLSENAQIGAIHIKNDYGALIFDDEEESEEAAGDDNFAEFEVTEAQAEQDEDYPNFRTMSLKEAAEFQKAIEEIINKPENSEALEFYHLPSRSAYFYSVFQKELNIAIGGMLIVMVLCLILLFRCFSALVWPLVIMLSSTAWVCSLVGWFQMNIETQIYIVIILVMVIAIADAIHILSGYIFFRNQDQDHQTAIRSAYKKSGLACFLTSVTTAIGMLSLVLLPIEPVKNMGILSAVGVIFAFLITIFLMPLMLNVWRPYSKKQETKVKKLGEQQHFVQPFLRKIEDVGHRHSGLMILGFLVIAIFLGYQASKVRVDTNYLHVFKKGTDLRNTFDMMDEHMSGNSSLQVMIEMGKENALMDPAVLNAMEAAHHYMKSTHGHLVVRCESLVTLVKTAYWSLNEGRPEMLKIPQSPRVLEQTLFTFNNASPADRQSLVTDNYANARIIIDIKNAGTDQGEKIVKDTEVQLKTIFQPLKAKYPDLKVTLTGGMVIDARLRNYVSWSQVKSFGLALFTISIILLLIFRSLKAGMISIVPNLFPVLTVFGVMGWFGFNLDQLTLMVAPILIGIIVDDTIHFIFHYRYDVIENKGNIKQAITQTIREAGQAILFTSLILSISFVMLLPTSTHQGIFAFGLLSVAGIVSALIADFFLIPALFTFFKVDFGTSGREKAFKSAVSIN